MGHDTSKSYMISLFGKHVNQKLAWPPCQENIAHFSPSNLLCLQIALSPATSEMLTHKLGKLASPPCQDNIAHVPSSNLLSLQIPLSPAISEMLTHKLDKHACYQAKFKPFFHRSQKHSLAPIVTKPSPASVPKEHRAYTSLISCVLGKSSITCKFRDAYKQTCKACF